jgi:hypothetical protein
VGVLVGVGVKTGVAVKVGCKVPTGSSVTSTAAATNWSNGEARVQAEVSAVPDNTNSVKTFLKLFILTIY